MKQTQNRDNLEKWISDKRKKNREKHNFWCFILRNRSTVKKVTYMMTSKFLFLNSIKLIALRNTTRAKIKFEFGSSACSITHTHKIRKKGPEQLLQHFALLRIHFLFGNSKKIINKDTDNNEEGRIKKNIILAPQYTNRQFIVM